ncbi:MAG: PCRF domain-containing protein, partial [Firmicutes bacterium]|nr:PCRF domain-containing protein [Bacillota bacterium]
MASYDNKFRLCTSVWRTSGGLFDVEGKAARIADAEARMAAVDFWDDADKAQRLIAEINEVKGQVDRFFELKRELDDAELSLELAQEEGDLELFAEADKTANSLLVDLDSFDLELLLEGPY